MRTPTGYDFVLGAGLGSVYRFERIVAKLHEAALGQARWPSALALIDDACEMHGSHVAIVEVDGDAIHYKGGWFCSHGRSLDHLERRYIDQYFQSDERVRRLLLLPIGCWLSNEDVYTENERKTSPTYNDFLPQWSGTDQLHGLRPRDIRRCTNKSWLQPERKVSSTSTNFPSFPPPVLDRLL